MDVAPRPHYLQEKVYDEKEKRRLGRCGAEVDSPDAARGSGGRGECGGGDVRRQRAEAAEEQESAAEATCGGGGGEGSDERGRLGSRIDAGCRMGNAARCLEVGLVSAWKIEETGPENLAKQASKDVR